MKPKRSRSPRTKIRPFSVVPHARFVNTPRDPRFVYLENKRIGVKLPLQDSRGLLNGAFETPSGEILEIRYRYHHSFMRHWNAYIGNKKTGTVNADLTERETNKGLRRLGIATALFERAEPAEARYQNQGLVSVGTSKKNTAKFFLSRGFISEPFDRAVINGLRGEQPEEGTGSHLFLRKRVRSTPYDNPQKWHRIRVIGKDRKPKWYTLRVIPLKEAKT